MNVRFIYDLEKRIFVDGSGVRKVMRPEIAYGMKPVWEWEFINASGESWDFTGVVSWRAAIDDDFKDETNPMCRTLSGIYHAGGVVYCPLDAHTTTYRTKANGKALVQAFFDLTGFSASGVRIFYFRCPVDCLYVLDPDDAVDPLDPPETLLDPAQVAAIAQGIVDAALDAYTPPPGGDGPPGPGPLFEFSATGISGTWHASWASGDLYLRVSSDEGETWQGPIPIGTAQTIFPILPAWSGELTYAAGALVVYGTPSGMYQANAPVGYDQSPESHPEKWREIAGPGQAGRAGSSWLTGTSAPAQETGLDGDQYLDASYNHYIKIDGAWVQQGNIRGANGAGINPRGVWDAAATYAVNDAATEAGSVWRAILPSSGQRPPADPETASLYWEIFLARGLPGAPGAAGTLQIVAVNMLAPTADPYVSEGTGSTPARRVYTLHIPRGSTGPAGSIRIEMGLPLEPDEAPQLNEINGSTPHNRAYQLRVSRGPRGERGAGLNFNRVGPLADRVNYNSAAAGYSYLATDLLIDDQDHPYQAMYIKQSSAIGDWSDPIRLYGGTPGQPGESIPGPPGQPGENVQVVPDLEFISDDLIDNALVIDGVKPVAQVEIYDAAGHSHAAPVGTGEFAVAIVTRWDVEKTLVQFGALLDLTHGGRVRFAHGVSNRSPYQAWLDLGNEGSEADFLASLKGADGGKGETGNTGSTGPANSLSIGTVTQGTAAATITGTAPTQTLNLTLPPGPANSLSIGTVAQGTAGATITGTAPAQTLNLTLPKGDPGEPLEDNYIEVTTADVTAGNIVIPGDTAPVGVEIAGVYYDIESFSKNGSTGNFEIPLAPILAEANLATLAGTWRIWRAGGKKGDTGSTGGTFAISQVTELPAVPDEETLYLIAP